MLLSVAACDAGGPEPPPLGPPLHVVAVEVTAARTDDTGAIILERLPLDGTTRPVTTTAFHVKVDRYLDPRTASRQAICLQSAAAPVNTLADCTDGLLLRPTYDPVTRTVSYHQATATSRLPPDTFFRLTVLTATEESDFGLRAFDGAPLEGNYVFDFATALEDPALETEGPAEGPLDCGTPACDARCATLPPETLPDGSPEPSEQTDARRRACAATCPILRGPLASCTAGGCHAPSGSLAPAMGLDLSSPEGIATTARGAIAHQTQRGAQAAAADVAGASFGRAMPVIAPGDPGRSYLLYKLLASPSFADDPTLADGETERLREAVVVGLPMPPSPYTAPTRAQLEDLVAWIAAGAELGDCR